MKIDTQSVDALNSTLSVLIEKADYEADFKNELKKYAGKVQMKGFRKGKTPISTLKKMYGVQVLADVINNKLQEAVSSHITDNKLNILGQPIPTEGQEQISFDVNTLKDYDFKFDIGLAPEFDLNGVSESDTYDINDVQLDDTIVNEEIEHITKRMGTQEDVDGQVEEKDILTIQAEELDGDNPKENGWATEFTVMVDTMSDEYKEAILKLSKDDSFNFDIYALEANKTEDYVKKYLLNSEEEADREIGKDFTGKIAGIKRLKAAEFNQELFDKYFGEGEVSSEDDAKAKIKENIQKHYDNQATQIMYREIMDKMIEDTQMTFPESFLKRWLKTADEKNTDEKIEEDFEGFLSNLKWTLIKSKLAEKFDVKVEGEDVYAAMEKKVRGYFGQYGMDDQYMGQIMKNMMENREEVNKTYEEVLAERIFGKIGDTVARNKKAISLKDFNEMVKELNAKQQSA